MLALTFHGKQSIKLSNVPLPRIEADTDVIVRTTSVGLCGSDLHTYHEREQGCDHGCVMGHEFVGVVAEIGTAIKRLSVGDRVMCPFTTNCGDCFYCRCGLTARCTRGQLFGWRQGGKGLHGGQAEYLRVPLADTTLECVPKDISDDEAILCGDILSTAYMCCENGGLVAGGGGGGDQGTSAGSTTTSSSSASSEEKDAGNTPGRVVCVLGLGPVGLLATLIAKALGGGGDGKATTTVVAIDRVSGRLAAAHRFGAVPVNLDDEQGQAPLRVVQSLTDGRGADVVLEVVGAQPALALAMTLLRPGGVLSSVGAHTDHTGISPVHGYDKNLTFRIGRCSAHHYMNKVSQLLQSGKLPRDQVNSIITHHIALADGVQAYDMFDKKRDGCIKVVLVPPSSSGSSSTSSHSHEASMAADQASKESAAGDKTEPQLKKTKKQ